ncbi:MAG: hypothetical protein Q4G27_10285 [Flavobacteriaceae bacterium]|nr:hypothetical protein [Flavobacteriaceae bacterium]
MKKLNLFGLLIVLFGLSVNLNGQYCPTTFDPTITDNFVGTFHSGALKDQTGTWYAWGENMPNSGHFREINSANGYLPSGVTPLKVSGGSDGIGYNQLVILGSDAKIYGVGIDDMVLTTTGTSNPISLPSGVAATSVTSFFASKHTIAIVAGGKGYVWAKTTTPRGDGATVAGWSASVKSSATGHPEITDFVQIRGDGHGSGGHASYIGLTSTGKIYVWGHSVIIPTATPSSTLSISNQAYAVEVVNMPAGAGKPVMVGANKPGDTVSFYFMTDNRQLWAVGDNQYQQLGDFTETNRAAWVQVQKSATEFADVIYFSTAEHEGVAYNKAYTMMITTNGSLYGFGTNSDGVLGNGSSSTTTTYGPAISTNAAAEPIDGSTPERTATFVEAGGHITFLIRADGSGCIAGHGINGSLFGSGDTNSSSRFGSCIDMPAEPCIVIDPTPVVDAVDDTLSIVAGQSSTTSVVTNDLNTAGNTAVIGTNAGQVAISTVTNATGTAGAWPTGFTLNPDGTVSVAADAPIGEQVLYYKMCQQTELTVCDVAQVTVTVGDPDTDKDGNPNVTDPNPNTPTAVNDTATATPGEPTTIDVLANDDYLTNQDPNNLGSTTITNTGNGTAQGTVSFDPNTGEMTYTPTVEEAESDVTVEYQVCNTNTNTCDTATVTVSVGAVPCNAGTQAPVLID